MEWDERKQDQELLKWYSELIRLRKRSPSLQNGEFQTAFADDEANVFAFYRFCEGETSLVILNAGAKPYQTSIKEKGWQKVFPLPSTDNPSVVSPEQTIAVPACCVGIIQKKVKVQK